MSSKINIHRGTFLEKEELRRMISFLSDHPEINAVISSSVSFGLCSPGGKVGIPFKVTPSPTIGAIDMIGGYVIGSDFRGYRVEDHFEFPIPPDNRYYWMKVSSELRNHEKGVVQVDKNGSVSGTVNFEGIVRGQSSGVPSCIKFEKEDGTTPLNNLVYQVVDMVSPNNIILASGKKFIPENNLRVIVLGSIPMGKKFTNEQLEGLYTFDTYKISLILETAIGVMPPKSPNEFYIARVRNNAGAITVLDERKEFWRLGSFGSGGGGGSDPGGGGGSDPGGGGGSDPGGGGGSDPGGGGEPQKYVFEITPNPLDSRVIINGKNVRRVEASEGEELVWFVSKAGYITKSETYRMEASNKVLEVQLEQDSSPVQKVVITVKTAEGNTSKGAVAINSADFINNSIDSANVNKGTSLNICAKPAQGYTFSGWTKNGQAFNKIAIQEIIATEQTTFIANFEEKAPERYWDFEVKKSGNSYELFSVPQASVGGYEGVMVKIQED